MITFPFRHERVRKEQERLMLDAYLAFKNGKFLFAHAPTGLGKTDAIISAWLKAREEGERLLFLTPKRSQHKIVLEVVSGINKKFGEMVKAISIVGKKNMCLHAISSNLDTEIFYKGCEVLKARKACEYFLKVKYFDGIDFSTLSSEKIIEEAKRLGMCPYEIALSLARNADVLVIDYNYVFQLGIRKRFFWRTRINENKLSVVIDEAHNLPKRIRDIYSSTLSAKMLKRVEKEIEAVGYEKLEFSEVFEKVVPKTEGEVGRELMDVFLHQLGIEKETLIDFLEMVGYEYLKERGKRSYSLRFARFLELWWDEGIRFVEFTAHGRVLRKKLFDVSRIVEEALQVKSGVFMSGTLKPMEMFLDLLGVPGRSIAKEYRSPFPKENKRFIFLPYLTTKYEHRTELMCREYASLLEIVNEHASKNIAVFFPSYDFMREVMKYISFSPLVQKERMGVEEISKLFKKFISSSSVLFAVQGGLFSEGVDYPENVLKTIVIVGLPYEKPTIENKLYMRFLKQRYGKGFEYGLLYPAVTKVLQAVGRGVRREKDKVTVILADRRFFIPKIMKFFKDEGIITIARTKHELISYLTSN